MKQLICLFPFLILNICCSSTNVNYNSLISDNRVKQINTGNDTIFLYEYSDDYIIWKADTLNGVTTKVDSINVRYPSPYSPQTAFYFKIISDSIHITEELIDSKNNSQILFDNMLKNGNYGLQINGKYFDSGIYWLKSIYGKNKPVVTKFILLK